MKEILEKITSYNIFNYLLPGAVFGVWLNKQYGLDFGNLDILTNAFLYYFLGMVVSRFGSLIVEPILKKIRFVKFDDYSKFVKASKRDNTLSTLSESNNMYRTFISLFILIAIVEVYYSLQQRLIFLEDWRQVFAIIFLTLLFIFSYKKQTTFINKRIKANLDE